MSALNELAHLRREPGVGRRRLTKRERKEERVALGFLSPWVVGLVVITLGPMAASLYLSFTDYNFLQTPEWVGAENYLRLLTDERFHQALWVTFQYVVISVPLQLAAALLVAIVLDSGLRGLALYRSAFYLPSLLGGSVAIAILWRQIFGSDGLVNRVLELVGIEGLSWIANPETALGTLVILNVWTFGAPMIIFLAGLRQIPTMYYEAAAVDGASKTRRFVAITLPLLSPIIFFNLVLQLIGAFQSFTQAFIISGGTGAPADSTLFYTLYLYMRGFGNFEMGYASAMAWVLVIIIGGFTAINFAVSKFWVFYDD
ncbi:MAG: carbohydrate ABC transporter permease [Microbacterium gubbeenense]|uniref:carbohydrate ABC transporter permease n=1 Tax=Microbacterium gubbeenense TaxID=159896 RepID=UPI003F99EF1E